MLNFLFINTPLLFFIQSFWRDEAFSYLLARKNIFEILFLTAKDFNPPLYYLILHFWVKIFGSTEIAIRSLSLIFYWVTIYISYLFLVDILKIKIRKKFLFFIFYFLFFLVNPLLTYYAFEGRMYTMLTFFAALSSYAFLTKKTKLYLFSTIAGLYTHYFMFFILLIQFIFVRIRKQSFKNILTSLFFSLPWVIFVLKEKGGFSGSFWIEKPTGATLKQFFGIILTGYEKNFNFQFNGLSILSIAIFFLIIVSLLQKQKPFFFYLFLWGVGIPLVVFGLSFFKPFFLPRYLILATVGLLLLIVFIINRLPKVVASLTFIALVAIMISYQGVQIKYRRKSDYRKLYQEIKSLAKKNDFVYVVNELDYLVAQYYIGENRVFIYGKTYEEIPNYVGKVLIPKSAIVRHLPRYPQKAFVVISDSSYQIQSSL